MSKEISEETKSKIEEALGIERIFLKYPDLKEPKDVVFIGADGKERNVTPLSHSMAHVAVAILESGKTYEIYKNSLDDAIARVQSVQAHFFEMEDSLNYSGTRVYTIQLYK